VTAVIANEYGFDETCYIRICLDTINLISGILIFLVIVGKKSVLLSLRKKAMSWKTKLDTSSVSNTKETDLELK